jgi:hypothetical protein
VSAESGPFDVEWRFFLCFWDTYSWSAYVVKVCITYFMFTQYEYEVA